MPKIFLLVLLGALAQAHTQLFFLNTKENAGQDNEAKKKSSCVLGMGSQERNFPIRDVLSTDMTCGAPSNLTPAKSQCQVDAGETIQMVWGHDNPQDDFVAESHVGDCNVYMVPKAGAGGTAPKDGWFKLYEGIWDEQNKWCNDKLRTQTNLPHGTLPVTIPATLKPGSYYLRGEMNGLHEADTDWSVSHTRGIQFFVFCADIVVSGSGTALPAAGDTVSIPGYLNFKSPGVVFNLYPGNGVSVHDMGKSYPHLGPRVAAIAGGAGGGGSLLTLPPPANATTTLNNVAPSAAPSVAPSAAPSVAPSAAPSVASSAAPSASSTEIPLRTARGNGRGPAPGTGKGVSGMAIGTTRSNPEKSIGYGGHGNAYSSGAQVANPQASSNPQIASLPDTSTQVAILPTLLGGGQQDQGNPINPQAVSQSYSESAILSSAGALWTLSSKANVAAYFLICFLFVA